MAQCREVQRIEYPKEEDKTIKYNDFWKQLASPDVIYCDFECITKPTHEDDDKNKNTTKKNKA